MWAVEGGEVCKQSAGVDGASRLNRGVLRMSGLHASPSPTLPAAPPPSAAILGAGLYFWQMPHFMALAWMCKADYAGERRLGEGWTGLAPRQPETSPHQQHKLRTIALPALGCARAQRCTSSSASNPSVIFLPLQPAGTAC